MSAIEDIIDDFLGGSHSEAMDVLVEAFENSANGSAAADLEQIFRRLLTLKTTTLNQLKLHHS